MFTKFFPKDTQSSQEILTFSDLEPRVSVHYGIPSTASILAFDPIQNLLAIGTLDGRIKVIGGDNIEGLLMSPKPLPFKNLEFLQNQGFLVSVSNENEIQIWDLENRRIASHLQWESNITAFSVIYGSQYMYVGDEYGFLSVLKYNAEEGKILQLPYHVPSNIIAADRNLSIEACEVGSDRKQLEVISELKSNMGKSSIAGNNIQSDQLHKLGNIDDANLVASHCTLSLEMGLQSVSGRIGEWQKTLSLMFVELLLVDVGYAVKMELLIFLEDLREVIIMGFIIAAFSRIPRSANAEEDNLT
ncbi:unnamed protein product [Ilex paraguariensis]|uniref:Uncharacterized protein n=1 Tax=Ilex paraguariensis TaxID=185542 RepID=A0ABC8TVS6_9AQUA